MTKDLPEFTLVLPETKRFEAALDVTRFIESEPRRSATQRPWLLINMISSFDGAVSIDGLSGGLGGPADKVVFRALRGLADAILVGAGTARAENYGPPTVTSDTRERRVARGQLPKPMLALVTRSGSLNPTGPLFEDPDHLPLVYVAAGADPDRVSALEAVTEVTVSSGATDDGVDLAGVLDDLGNRGCRVVLAEGGPSLNADLVAAGLVDEFCLSLSPLLVSGDSPRIVHGDTARPTSSTLSRALAADDLLFLRYLITPT